MHTSRFLLVRASVGMPSGRASVPVPQRWRVAHGKGYGVGVQAFRLGGNAVSP